MKQNVRDRTNEKFLIQESIKKGKPIKIYNKENTPDNLLQSFFFTEYTDFNADRVYNGFTDILKSFPNAKIGI